MEYFASQDPRSYSLYFDLNIWFRARKVTGTFEKRAPDLPHRTCKHFEPCWTLSISRSLALIVPALGTLKSFWDENVNNDWLMDVFGYTHTHKNTKQSRSACCPGPFEEWATTRTTVAKIKKWIYAVSKLHLITCRSICQMLVNSYGVEL